MMTGMISTLGFWPLQSGEAVLPGNPQSACLYAMVADSNETSIPYDLGPTGIFVHATGQIVVVESPDQFVEKTVKYIQSMAFLPVDEDDELLIDRLVEKRTGNQASSPLTRRL